LPFSFFMLNSKMITPDFIIDSEEDIDDDPDGSKYDDD
jgi:hypothetical protein